MTPLKTLHLTNAYHASSGGIRTMYHALLEQANREHRLMRLVVPAEDDRVERVGRFGMIYHLRASRAPVVDRRYRLLLPHRFVWAGLGRLWSIVNHEAPDVLEVSDKYSLCYLAGLLRRLWPAADRPTLIGLSCERLDDNVGAHIGAFRHDRAACRAYLGRIYIGMFDAHIANSEYTADELRAAMVPRHPRPVHVCPMGVHLPLPLTAGELVLARRDLFERTGGSEVPLVLYAGRLSPEKNVTVLPAVLAALVKGGSPAHFVIAGEGPLREWLTAAMRDVAPGRAHFLGHVTDPRMLARYVAVSDVFLHPNPREPFGIGPLEAMAAGTPLVAPDAGGVRSYATCDNAWLTSAEPASLAAGVLSVLDGADRARRIANAELTARQFVWPAAASRIFETYDRVHAARLAGRTGHHAPGGAVGVMA